MHEVNLPPEELCHAVAFFRPNRPVLVTTLDRDGTLHVAPFAWCVPTSAEPPMVTLALLTSPRKQHTLVNIERHGQFVVNFPGHDLAAELVKASYRVPPGVRKAALLDLEVGPPQRLDVPTIRQCRAHIECLLKSSMVTGDHTLLVADVVAASCTADQAREDMIPDPVAHPPCLHLGHVSLTDRQVHTFMVGGEARSLGVPFSLVGCQPAADAASGPAQGVRFDPQPGPDGGLPVGASVLASGFSCPAGLCCGGAGGDLFAVDWATGQIHRLTAGGEVVDVVDTGGMPAGACCGPGGRLYVCDPGRKELLAVSAGGKVQVMAGGHGGQPFLGPLDCALDAAGNLYLSDADGSQPVTPSGRVYLIRPDGTVELFADGFAFPGGLSLSPGGDALYLAETYTRRIHRFPLDAAGHAGGHHLFAELEGGTGPVGLTVDPEGRVYAAHFGKGVAVLSPSGVLLAELPIPGCLPSGVAFWNGSLCVTELENGSVLRFPVGAVGAI